MSMLKTLRLAAAILLYSLLNFIGLKGLAGKLDAHATEKGWGS